MTFYRTIKILTICILILAFNACKIEEQKHMDLSGKWNFKLDSLDIGEKESWFKTALNETVILPGSMAENAKGNDITVNTHWTGNMWNDSLWYKDPKMKKYRQKGHVKVPFWLTPVKDYKGAAWYKKTVSIPAEWNGKKIELPSKIFDVRFLCFSSFCLHFLATGLCIQMVRRGQKIA